MRKALRIIAAVVMTAISGSCTHNNGDIGPWFGEWKLTSIEIDGSPDAAYKANTFWVKARHHQAVGQRDKAVVHRQ